MFTISKILKNYMKYMQIHSQHATVRKCSYNGIFVSEEVKAACAESKPVVALETAVLTHGLPLPINIETALEIENIIRSEGSIPATIGVIKGKVIVGLCRSEIEELGEKFHDCFKVSRRDFPYVLAKKSNGGTTVSGTMLIAHMVGINTFATGGIGGVHRGGESSMDVSADLIELGRTPVTVVCGGIKSILDVGKTLEYLETQGVCVAVMGSSKEFPGFFTEKSGYKAPYCVQLKEAVKMMHEKDKLGLRSGMLLAVPIPSQYQADGQLIQEAIDYALIEAASNVQGRDITPFVLKRVQELSGNKSLTANIALLKNNAKVAAILAKEYSIFRLDRRTFFDTTKNEKITRNRPVCD